MTSPIHKKFKMSDDKDDISSSDAGAAHTMDAKSMNKFSRQIAALGMSNNYIIYIATYSCTNLITYIGMSNVHQ